MNIVFVTLRRFYSDTLRYQNIKYLSLTESTAVFMFALRMMQLFSQNKVDFTKLTQMWGLYFQIRDDYCNLCLQEVTSDLSVLDVHVAILMSLRCRGY
jgi:hypothetical protein